MHHGHVFKQGIFVIIPIMLQSVCIRIFTTGHFYSDFKSVSIQVIIVLHTTSNIVPFCTIGDTCNRELWNKFFKIWYSKFWKLIATENIPYIQIWPESYLPLGHRSERPGRLLNVLFTFSFGPASKGVDVMPCQARSVFHSYSELQNGQESQREDFKRFFMGVTFFTLGKSSLGYITGRVMK